MTGMVAPKVLDGPIKGNWFEANVGQVLVPDLRRGDVVIMDNLSSYKRASVRDLIEAADGSFRPIVTTSPRSRRPSPASRPCSERSANAP